MESHELLRAIYKDTSPKVISQETGLSLSMVYKWAQAKGEGQSGINNPLDRIAELIQITDDQRLVQWICAQFGGFYVKSPKRCPKQDEGLMSSTSRMVQETADLLSIVSCAAYDNHIDSPEAARIRKRWETLKTVVESFVHACEEGNFQAIRQEANRDKGRDEF
jgi:hypothetical protein